MITLDKDYDVRRQQVWLEAWVQVANSNSCINDTTATLFADRCLKEFDKRFKPEANTRMD